MFVRWPSFIASRFDKIKERCRKGIPGSVRGQAWYHLSAAKYRQENEDRNCPMGSLFYYYLGKQVVNFLIVGNKRAVDIFLNGFFFTAEMK